MTQQTDQVGEPVDGRCRQRNRRPDRDRVQAHIAAATEDLLTACRALPGAAAREKCALPGWTRGHLLTHVARGADGLRRLLDWARTGVENPQYASHDARAGKIEAGAGRPWQDMVDDAERTADAFHEDLRTLPPHAWRAAVRPVTGERCTPERILVIRLREVVVHHVDLAVGYTFERAPGEAAGIVLDDVAGHYTGRAEPPAFRLHLTDTGERRSFGAGGGPVVTATRAAALGWLTGRAPAPSAGAPQLPPWI
ncbi:maleylpyruvate isomerase family mycothiol-dependent enzyme [Streptomyces chattanoogensis]